MLKIDNKHLKGKGEVCVRGSKTDEELKETVRALLESGENVKSVHEKTGVSIFTIYTWRKNDFQKDDAFTKARNENKEKVINKSWEHVNKAMSVIGAKLTRAIKNEKNLDNLLRKIEKNEELSDTAIRELMSKVTLANSVSLGDAVRTVGVLIDKINLMSGEATQNVNVYGEKFEDL